MPFWDGAITHILAPLPRGLETLELSAHPDTRVHPILGQLPQCLRVLNLQHVAAFNSALGPLPPSLTSLSLGPRFTQPLGELPRGLTALTLGTVFPEHHFSHYDHPLGRLPCALRVLDLEICDNFNHPLGCLPATLRKLLLGWTYNHPLQTLPPALEVLVLGHDFQQELQPHLPDTLRVFRMGECFNAPVMLPAALEDLRIGDSYTHLLDLRPSLRHVYVGLSYPRPLPPLPQTFVSDVLLFRVVD
ncbi:hypothetical protein JKP88DRAFT_181321 [Tribonema minus]|uniref:Uncharacterized protein n=1 Tax=Tribonema minus TaxID=303371 RepID=A0A835Z283_9STRA|nr:hypothetical protein JKP88DRAFT_181321 [Tribonema minus]